MLRLNWTRVKRTIVSVTMAIISTVINCAWVFYVIFRNYLTATYRCILAPARKSIEGEVAVVTGAGHGIGREIALELSRYGAILVLLDVNQADNVETAETIKRSGGRAFPYLCDVTSSSRVFNVFAKIKAEVGNISILVNNAGILNGGKFLDMDELDIRRTFEVNTLSQFWTVKECLPTMIKQKLGHIMNVASISGYIGTSYLTDYSASKHATIGFTEALIDELECNGHAGIKVTALCPMYTDTGMVTLDTKCTFKMLTAAEVAKQGVDGMLRNYELVTVPSYYWLLLKLRAILPRNTSRWLAQMQGGLKPKYIKRTY